MPSFFEYTLDANREIILIECRADIQSLCRLPPTPYNLVRIASLLRFLFISEGGFVNLLNKKFKYKLRKPLKPVYSTEHGLSSIYKTHGQATYLSKFVFSKENPTLKINELLNTVVLSSDHPYLKSFLEKRHIESSYTLQSLIKLISNGHGGSHIEMNWENIPIHIACDTLSPFNINPQSILNDIIRHSAFALLYLSEELFLTSKLRMKQGRISSASVEVKINNKPSN
jgi:hypothetical protein